MWWRTSDPKWEICLEIKTSSSREKETELADKRGFKESHTLSRS